MKLMASLLSGIVATAVLAGGLGYAVWSAQPASPVELQAAASALPPFAAVSPFFVDDAAGDAKDLGFTRLSYGPDCLIDCIEVPTSVHAASDRAASFDLVGVGLAQESEDAFVIELRVARIADGFADLDAPPGQRRVAEFGACWTPDEESARRCALVDVAPRPGGANVAASFHIRGADACNDWMGRGWCAWQIPVEVHPGAPGAIRFTVPKTLAAFDDAPLALGELRGWSGWFSTNGAIPLWHAAWTVHANGEHQHEHAGILEASDVADVTPALDALVTLSAAPPRDASAATSAPLMTPGLGSLGEGGLHDDPELDLVALDLREEGDTLVASFQLARFEAMPSWDLQYALIFGVAGGTTFEVGLMQANGESYGYAGRCISFGCHDGFLRQVEHHVDAETGTVHVIVPRDTWPELVQGGVVDLTIAYTMFGEANVDVGTAGAPAYGNVHTGSVVDVAFGGAPFALHAWDGEAHAAEHRHA